MSNILLKITFLAALIALPFMAHADTVTTAGTRIINNPTSNADLKLRVNVGGTATDAISIAGSTAAVTVNGALTATKTTDQTLSLATTGTANVSRAWIHSGNATTSGRFAYVTTESDETTGQRWDFGLYGDKNYTLRDVTNSRTPLSISASTGNITVLGIAGGAVGGGVIRTASSDPGVLSGGENVTTIFFDTSGNNIIFSGLTGNLYDGRMLYLCKTSTSNTLSARNDSSGAGSVRTQTGSLENIVASTKQGCVMAMYDNTAARWRLGAYIP
jgi:hypothetical protein